MVFQGPQPAATSPPALPGPWAACPSLDLVLSRPLPACPSGSCLPLMGALAAPFPHPHSIPLSSVLRPPRHQHDPHLYPQVVFPGPATDLQEQVTPPEPSLPHRSRYPTSPPPGAPPCDAWPGLTGLSAHPFSGLTPNLLFQSLPPRLTFSIGHQVPWAHPRPSWVSSSPLVRVMSTPFRPPSSLRPVHPPSDHIGQLTAAPLRKPPA